VIWWNTSFDVDRFCGSRQHRSVSAKFTIISDHYCGIGHGNMKMKVTVVE
jgi:hypothetical protein